MSLEPATQPPPSPPAHTGARARRRPRSFLRKTLDDLRRFLEEALFAERIAASAGVLQGFDARAKLFVALCLAVALTAVRTPAPLAAALVLVLPVAAWSAIPTRLYWARLWPFTIGVTALMTLPSVTSWVRPGPSLWRLWTFADGATLDVTRPGLEGAATLSLRVAAIASWVAACALTTRWDRTLGALQALGVPAAFRLIAVLCYRYLFLLCDLVHAEHLARESRTARADVAADGRWVAGRAGALLLRANHASEEVFLAMQARGAGAAVRVARPPRLRPRDLVLVAGGAALLAVTLWRAWP